MKIICLGLMFILTLLFGLIPVKLVHHFKRKALIDGNKASQHLNRALTLMGCFSGGVFLGTTLLHLFPEVKEMTQQVLNDYKFKTKFAVAEFMISMGFFLVMFLEHLVMSLQHHHGDVDLESENDKDETNPLLKGYGTIEPTEHKKGTIESQDGYHDHEDRDSEHHQYNHNDTKCSRRQETSSHGHHLDTHSPYPPDVVQGGTCVHIINPSHHQHHHIEPDQLGGVRSFILLLAMSLHTVFEGMAIGLQKTESATWNLFIAIIIHKCIIAFTLGIQFMENLKYMKRAILFVVLFAFMSPLGVAIGTAVTESGTSNELATNTASATLQALATGTFIYVTFFEVLYKEVGADHSLVKVLFIIIGYGLMVLINLFNQEPDN